MPNVVDQNFNVRHFIENEIRIRRHNQTADGWIVRPRAYEGMRRQKIGEGF